MDRRVHPSLCLLAAALGVGVVLRSIFLTATAWLWSFAPPYKSADITPWTRPTLFQRDGAEPYALLAAVLVEIAATGGIYVLLTRLPRRWQAGAVVALLGVGAGLSGWVSCKPPMFQVAPALGSALLVVAVSLLAALWLRRSTEASGRMPRALPPILLAICLIPTTLPMLLDLQSILAPALRIQHGTPLREIYMQYDLLPSLLALGWHKVGGAPMGFAAVVGGASYFVMLLGTFWLARRLLGRADWAALLIVCLVVVRVYGNMMDATATPQVTPLRLELWLVLVAVTLSVGLRHWLVGLTLGLLLFFSRSMGTLYLGAYALALGGDFIARLCLQGGAPRPPFLSELRGYARGVVAPALLVVVAALIVRLVFGGFSSDAVRLYRGLGVGMLRIVVGSFFWWILPLLGVLGCLTVIRWRWRTPRQAQAALFVLALTIANSLYFFGRSHEHALVNLSTSYLLCLFLVLDLASPTTEEAAPGLRRAFGVMPWLVVAYCAFFYSGRVLDKVTAQHAVVARYQPLPLAVASDFLPVIQCNEISKAAGDGRVFFFSASDFYLYHQCGYVPQGYIQPVQLAVLKKPLVQELNRLLDDGYKIVVTKQGPDWGRYFPEFQKPLGNPELVESRNYQFYRRPLAAK